MICLSTNRQDVYLQQPDVSMLETKYHAPLNLRFITNTKFVCKQQPGVFIFKNLPPPFTHSQAMEIKVRTSS